MLNKYMIIMGAFSNKKQAMNYAKQLEEDGYPSFIIGQLADGKFDTERVKTVEELYKEVMDLGLNGKERKAYLGDRYEEVQGYINNKHR